MNVKKYRHLFGPVQSRRLGVSLGIDMVQFKTCSLDCIYCECGPTTQLTLERKEYVKADEIIEELKDYLSKNSNINYVTFGGSGEPTLNTAIGPVLAFLKKSYPQYKTALLTNGTLFYLPEVREAVFDFDLVLPSLDAISSRVFVDLNRPHDKLDNEIVIKGLEDFSRIYKGTIWLEVFIVAGLNDTPEELARFKDAIVRINPSRVQLNSLDRPGAVDWIRPAPIERLKEIADFLLPLPVEIISRAGASMPAAETTSIEVDQLTSQLQRRPLTIEEIATLLRKTINEVAVILDTLQKDGKILSELVGSRVFYKTK